MEKITDKLLQMVEDQLLSKDYLILSCLKYMDDNQLMEMCELNEIDVEDL